MKVFLLLLFCSIVSCRVDGERNVKSCGKLFELRGIERYLSSPLERTRDKSSIIYSSEASEENIEKLEEALKRAGFGEWIEGGVTYGSLSIGSKPNEEVRYSMKRVPGADLIIAHDIRSNAIHFIHFST